MYISMDDINLENMTPEQIMEMAIKDAKEKIDAIKRFDGLKIKLIGCWIWVSGETKANKENLKMQGFFHVTKIERNKVVHYWCWKPDYIESKPHRPQRMRNIANKYGVAVDVVGSDPRPEEE